MSVANRSSSATNKVTRAVHIKATAKRRHYFTFPDTSWNPANASDATMEVAWNNSQEETNMYKPSAKFILATASILLALSQTADAAVFVRVAPPRPLVERPVRRPGPAFVWTAGYHRWTGRAYVWVPGRWVAPPRVNAIWAPPRWEYVPAQHAYVFVAGFWR